MKRFLLKISLLSVVLAGLLFLLEQGITQGLKKSNSYTFVDWNNIYEGRINAAIIINGSSKALVQVSPLILDSVLQLSSYNLGINGHDFYMQDCKYSIYEQHNTKPKLIVQVISNGTLIKREDLYQLEQFLPYLHDSTLVQTTKDYVGLDLFDYSLPFARYFGHSNIIKEGLLSYFGIQTPPKLSKYKGYAPKNLQWDNSFERFKKYFPKGKILEPQERSIQKFKAFIQRQQQNNIPLVLVYPPTYAPSQPYINNRAQIMDLYQAIAQQYQVLLLDYSQMPLTNQQDFFYNSQHLNKQGAELFSRRLANDLKTHFPSLEE